MEKCEHNRNIALFCIYEHCSNREAGGCEECMKKNHSHVGNAEYIRTEDVDRLIEKFNIENLIKPKCRQFQELVFSFFTQVKTEFAQSLDIVSKSMVNKIGYPLLSNLNLLSTYKKVKHKEYRKLSAKEIKKFFVECKGLELSSVARKEKELYCEEIVQNFEVIERIESLMKDYERLAKTWCKNFKHDSGAYKKIDDLKKYLNSVLKISKKENEENPKDVNSKAVASNLETSPSSEANIKASQSVQQKSIKNHEQPTQRQKESKPEIQKNKKSIESATQNNSKNVQYFSVEKEIRVKEEKSYDQKEKEIFERKEKLMKMMNLEEKSIEKPLENFIGKTLENSVKNSLDVFLQAPPQLTFEKSSKRLPKKNEIQETSTITEQKRARNSFLRFGMPQAPVLTNKQMKSPKSEIKRDNSVLSFKDELLSNAKLSKNSEESECDVKYKYGMGILPSSESNSSEEENLLKSYLNGVTEKKKKDKMSESSPVKIQVNQISKAEETASNEEKSAYLYLKSKEVSSKESIKYLKASLHYSPKNLSAAEYLSFMYLKENKAKECLDLCNDYLSLLTKCEDTSLKITFLSDKSASLNSLGRESESITLLEAELPHIEHAKMYKNLGDAYFFVGINEKCQYNYEKAIKLDYKFDEAMYNLAACLFIQGNFYGANVWIRRALQVDSRNQEYILLRDEIGMRLEIVVEENPE